VIEHGGDEDQAIAGLLHDVICTDGVPDETAASGHGKSARRPICGASTLPIMTPCWRRPARSYTNARAIEEDMASIGPAVFDRFTARYAGTKWYYRALEDVFAARLGESSPVVGALPATLDRTYV
jgi:hypothetical protein